MCYSRIINKKINRLHERCLRIIYGDRQLPFEELLEKDSSVSIYERNILATEMYKVSKGASPHVTELFAWRNEHPYNLRHNAEFLQLFVNFVRCVTEVSHVDNLCNFKKVTKKWKPENSPYRIFKAFVKNIGFCRIAWIIMFLRPLVFSFFILFYFFNFYILKFKF